VSPIFVVGVGRSGTTHVVKAIGKFLEVGAEIEPAPMPALESRLDIESGLSVSTNVERIRSYIGRVEAHRKRFGQQSVYVEKTVSAGPYLNLLAEYLDARIVLVVRNGLDVVHSWTQWSDSLFGNIYRDEIPHHYLTKTAESKVLNYPLHADLNDLSFPRPRPNDDMSNRWLKLSRIGKFSYGWDKMLRSHLNSSANVGPERFALLKVEADWGPQLENLLPGFSSFLESWEPAGSTNSITERFPDAPQVRSRYEWTTSELSDFWEIAGDLMQQLAYEDGVASTENLRSKPPSFGEVWEKSSVNDDWFEWMHSSRIESHDALTKWATQKRHEVTSVLEVGSGTGVFYPGFFRSLGIPYVGLDLSARVIRQAEAKSNRMPEVDFFNCDVCDFDSGQQFDLVFSQGTLDNHWDINRSVLKCIRLAKKFVYIVFYRQETALPQHVYEWREAEGCFYNDVSFVELTELINRDGGLRWDVQRVFVRGSGVEEIHLVIEKLSSEPS
jgi:SAM-dependent methyltransferase